MISGLFFNFNKIILLIFKLIRKQLFIKIYQIKFIKYPFTKVNFYNNNKEKRGNMCL